MRIGVMQPYFMPYIGYWQIINHVDEYVIYDDVNFIKGGWINRNRILVNGEPKYINIPMIGASSNKKINEIEISTDKVLKDKIFRKLEMSYQRAPFYYDVMDMMCRVIYNNENNLAIYLKKSIEEICGYLNIRTNLVLSSQIDKTEGLKSEERLLDICKRLKATEYYNSIGGKGLYSKDNFNREGIKLFFLKTNDIEYKQFNDIFIPNLSIIDVMMFNDINTIQQYLTKYELQ